jgi:hypothetical protein
LNINEINPDANKFFFTKEALHRLTNEIAGSQIDEFIPMSAQDRFKSPQIESNGLFQLRRSSWPCTADEWVSYRDSQWRFAHKTGCFHAQTANRLMTTVKDLLEFVSRRAIMQAFSNGPSDGMADIQDLKS